MYINIDKQEIKLEKQIINIPDLVIETLHNESDLTDNHLSVANQFLRDLDVKRIGFNGFKVKSYYEFIFKVDGDKFLDSHTERYEVTTNIDSVPVRIGTPSDFAILVIACKNPFMKSFYIDNDMYHFISISFSCKETKVKAILQYAKTLVNRILSKGNSFLIPDNVFMLNSSSDDLGCDFEQPSLSDLIFELNNIHDNNYKSENKSKLFALISKSYNVKEESRFLYYYKILEYLARKQKVSQGESKFSKFLCSKNEEFKKEIATVIDEEVKYDDMVEFIRILRNAIIHPTVKIPINTIFYPIKKAILFQKILINRLTNFQL